MLWTSADHPDRWRLAPLGLLLALLASPASAQEPSFRRTTDVLYGRKDGLALTLDVFQPAGRSNSRALIFVQSGGWVSSHDGINPLVMSRATARGYTVFVVVHGSQPRYTIPEVLVDLDRAVRWVRTHAGDYAIDPDRLGIFGFSAGGHLSLMQGTAGTPGRPEAKDPVERASSRVQAVAGFYPPTDFLNYGKPGEEAIGAGTLRDYAAPFDFTRFDPQRRRFERITDPEERRAIARTVSPINHVTPDDPPTLLIHGDADQLVPIQQSEIIVQKLREAGVEAQLVVKPGASHGWPRSEVDIDTLVSWFDSHLQPQTAPK